MANNKKGKGSATAAPTAATTTSASSGVAELQDHLNRAETAVLNNEFKVNALHKQWKTYLVRLSYMVIFVAFHQMQNPSTACLRDVKNYNKALTEAHDEAAATEDDGDAPKLISGYKVILLVLSDSMVHILAIVMACCLSFFLQQLQQQQEVRQQQQSSTETSATATLAQKTLVFSNARYMLSNACIPPLLSLYFGYQKTKDSESNLSQSSCLDGTLLERANVVPEERQRSLPLVLVFHVIVTACVWFMDMQQSQVAANRQRILKLKLELLQAQQATEQKKKK